MSKVWARDTFLGTFRYLDKNHVLAVKEERQQEASLVNQLHWTLIVSESCE
jgi:hypothetical protein